MSDLNNRLNILKRAGQIENDSIVLANSVIEKIRKLHNIELNEDNGAMLVTHIVMANERMKKKELINPLDESIALQLSNEKFFDVALDTLNEIILLFGEKFQESERNYILMHLLNILRGLDEGISIKDDNN